MPAFIKKPLLFSCSAWKSLPDAKPSSMIPHHGRTGYPIKKVKWGVILYPTRLNNGAMIARSVGLALFGIKSSRLWQKIITSPTAAIVFTELFKKKESIIKLKPIAAMTWKNRMRNWMSNQIPKLTTVHSKIMSHIPRVTRKRRICGISFLF